MQTFRRFPFRVLLGAFLASSAFVVLNVTPASATGTTWYVSSAGTNNGTNPCIVTAPCQTVTEAVAQAASGDTIDVAGTIDDNVAISKPATLTVQHWPAMPAAVLDGQAKGEVFSDSATGGTLTISGLTIQNGNGGILGGGIFADGPLVITGSTITSNTATGSGGILADGGLNMTNSVVSDNHGTSANGGGIVCNCTSASMIISASTITGNTTGNTQTMNDGGGGVFQQSGTATISDSTISGNTAFTGSGMFLNFVAATLTDDAITGNTGAGAGGGIVASGGSLQVNDSTIANNVAGNFGGILEDDSGGALVIDGSTVTGNIAAQIGVPFGGTINLAGDIVAKDGATTAADCNVSGTTVIDGGYNVADDASCAFTATGSTNSATAIDDYLGPLANNGGPTDTVPLLFSPSPTTTASDPAEAIPVANSLCTANGGFDQRGSDFPRVTSGATTCDIGAFEQQFVNFTSPDATTFSVGTADSFSVTTNANPDVNSITNAAFTGCTPSPALPSGVTFTDNGDGTATLAGPPGAATSGTYTLCLNASNGGASSPATQAFTLTVDGPPSITSANHATFVVGTAGTFTVTTNGAPPVNSIIQQFGCNPFGTFPTGLTFSYTGGTTATISGTPAAGTAGTYNFCVAATNGISPGALQPFTLQVNQAPSITSANNATFVVGTAGTFTVTTSGTPLNSITNTAFTGCAPSTLPSAVTFTDNGNGTATIAGTPGGGTSGTYTLCLNAANGVSPAATQSFTLTVTQTTITSASSTTFTAGTAGTFTVTTSGTPVVNSITDANFSGCTKSTLPSGVSFVYNGNTTATIAGTLAAGTSGIYTLCLNATNGSSPAATQTFTLTVDGPPSITSANHATFTDGSAGTFTVTTSGTPAVNSITNAAFGGCTISLPSGVTFTYTSGTTATIAGTPPTGTSGTYTVCLNAANGFSPAATQSFTLTVNGPPSITSANNATFTVGTAGTFTVTTTGTPAVTSITNAAFTGCAPSTLPSGVTFTPSGATAILAGTPAAGTAGTYTVCLNASNGVSPAAVQPFTLTVNAPPPPPPPAPKHGYWLVGSDGGIFTFGSANFFGSTGALKLNRPVVGITPTKDEGGYWLVATDGGIFAFGDSGYFGSIPGLGLAPAGTVGGKHLNAPIVGMVPSSSGAGYFMVASDGGVFAFGDAQYEGSCPGIGGCAGAAVGVAPDASGKGYWLVTASGHIYTFGDAANFGAPGTQSSTITSIVRTPDGGGYWILDGNGNVFAYGDAAFLGGLPGGASGGINPATAIFTTSDGGGYWVATALGKVYAFGDAPQDGDISSTHLNGSIIAATGF